MCFTICHWMSTFKKKMFILCVFTACALLFHHLLFLIITFIELLLWVSQCANRFNCFILFKIHKRPYEVDTTVFPHFKDNELEAQTDEVMYPGA